MRRRRNGSKINGRQHKIEQRLKTVEPQLSRNQDASLDMFSASKGVVKPCVCASNTATGTHSERKLPAQLANTAIFLELTNMKDWQDIIFAWAPNCWTKKERRKTTVCVDVHYVKEA